MAILKPVKGTYGGTIYPVIRSNGSVGWYINYVHNKKRVRRVVADNPEEALKILDEEVKKLKDNSPLTATSHNKREDRETYLHHLISAYSRTIKPLQPITKPLIKYGKGDEEQAVLVLSDWQLGHRTRSFNFEIAQERIQKLLESSLKIVYLHRQAYPIKVLNIFILGDVIQNELKDLIDLSELEAILAEQVFTYAVPLLVSLIKEYAKHFERINVYCVRGNHGRASKEASERSNWDDVIYHCVKANFKNIERVNFEIAKSFYLLVNIMEHKFLLMHGQEARQGSYLIPLYGIIQRMLRWATSMPFDWDVLIIGHWHNFTRLELNGKELIVNGTLVSDDEWVRKNLGWTASTSQTLFSVHPRRRITWMYKLELL